MEMARVWFADGRYEDVELVREVQTRDWVKHLLEYTYKNNYRYEMRQVAYSLRGFFEPGIFNAVHDQRKKDRKWERCKHIIQ